MRIIATIAVVMLATCSYAGWRYLMIETNQSSPQYGSVNFGGVVNITNLQYNGSPPITNVSTVGGVTNSQPAVTFSNLTIQGSASYPGIVVTNFDHSIGVGVYLILASGTCTQSLPAATGSGRFLNVKNAGTGVITLKANGTDKVDGESQWDFGPGTNMQVIDGSTGNWRIL